MLPLVSSFVQILMCLPHSSANVERLFSAINLMTKVRNKLNTKSVTGLLHTKGAMTVPCYEVQITTEHRELFNSMYDFKKNVNTDEEVSD